MTASWAEKYRPKSLAEVLGNPQAVAVLRAWAESWHKGVPEKRAALLHGPPGAGKTSAAHALARELGWGLIELNASDVRSGPAIHRVAGQGAMHETFSDSGEYFASREGKRKLIVLDEADNLYERGGEEATVGDVSFSDRGGRRAILETIAQSQQPILLIANDAYALTKGASGFARSVLDVPFRHLTLPTIVKALRTVANAEGIQVEDTALREVASHAHGDLRSALNDLQALAEGRRTIEAGAGAPLGERNRPETMFNAIASILKGEAGDVARRNLQALDEPPDFVLAWLDENVPREYRDPHDLAEAYDWLSRADVFLGRVMRRQQYALWGTATDLMAYGVTTAKKQPYPSPPYYQFPGWIRKMGATKGERALQKDLLGKVAKALHTGPRTARADLLPFLSRMAASDPEFAETLALRFDLDEDELRAVLREAPEAYADKIVKHVASRRENPPAQKEVESQGEPPAAAAPRGRSLMDF
ncbi:MAG: replication factor C large subunit [Euryarchaeota archaeon]|nr:replication factor C large subunit [Euryarchaeota archaeon]